MPDYNKYHDLPVDGLAPAETGSATPPTTLVTGATGALGRATALALAARGHRVVLLCRDPDRGKEVAEAVRAVSPSESAELLVADLSQISSVRSAVERFHQNHGRLNVLVNNAAVFHRRRETTPDGLESMFATNYLGPYLLTRLLGGDLRGGAPSFVVNITAPSTTPLDFDDPQGRRQFRALRAFGASKMANLLFTYELARRWTGSGVTVCAYFPGLVRSRLMTEAPAVLRVILRAFSHPPERAGVAIADLLQHRGRALTPGAFLGRGKALRSNAYSLDPTIQRRLWEASESLLPSIPFT